jgi:hypothetical protein
MKDINRRSTSAPSTIWAQSIRTCCWTPFNSLHGRLLARFSRPTTSTTGSPSLDRENLGRVLGVAKSFMISPECSCTARGLFDGSVHSFGVAADHGEAAQDLEALSARTITAACLL